MMRHLLPHFPAEFRDYYEPFLGGGAVFFEIGHQAAGRVVLADLNDELINTWLVVRDAPAELLEALERYDGANSEKFYYSIRDCAPTPSGEVERAARFLYLNQTAWNGLWRVNRKGRFNVPWGARPFRGIEPDYLYEVSDVLREAEVKQADFREVLTGPARGDFVYLDPPYLRLSDTSKFEKYTVKPFRKEDLALLAEICRELTQRGVHWVLSNRDTPLVRELFHDATVVALTTRRSVAAQNRRDVEPIDSREVIVIGGSS